MKKLISFNEKVEVSIFDEHSVASIRVTDNPPSIVEIPEVKEANQEPTNDPLPD